MRELIYNQHDIPKEQWRYGLRTSAATGCGWIATYNALHLLGYHAQPEELIRYYEHQLPLIHGNLGTSIWGPAVCFKHWGFPVKMTAKRSNFDRTVRDSDVSIVFYRWKKGCKIGAHFVAVRHTDQGFVGYNTFRNSTGPDFYGESLQEFLTRHKYFGAVVIAISDKR